MFFLIKKILPSGPEKCQNFEGLFEKRQTESGRHFSKFHLKRTLTNGSTIDREWIIYSPSRQSIFCFNCLLFGRYSDKTFFNSGGFNDWKNVGRSIKTHELPKPHLLNNVTFKQRVKRMSSIDESFENVEESEIAYWREVLYRIVEVIKFLSARGLAFRGKDQQLNSKHNGNYLGIIELMSKFDPFLKQHLENFGNKGKG